MSNPPSGRKLWKPPDIPSGQFQIVYFEKNLKAFWRNITPVSICLLVGWVKEKFDKGPKVDKSHKNESILTYNMGL